MTKEEFIEKIKELGFKNFEMVIEQNDNEFLFKPYNDKLKIYCKIFYNSVTLSFLADERVIMNLTTDVTYEFALFLIKKIENGFKN